MKHLLTTAALFSLTAIAAPAFAQSAYPDGFTPYGYVSLNYYDNTGGGSGSGETIFVGRTGFRWDFGNSFGVDYGLNAIATDSTSQVAHYLALAYRFGDMRLSVGAPVPAFDTYGQFRFGRQVPVFDILLSATTGSTFSYLDRTASGDDHSYGLRLDGMGSGLSYAVSLHGVTQNDDVFGLSASAQYAMTNDVVLTGGLEYIDVAGSDAISKVKFGVQKDFGQFDLALNAIHAENFPVSSQTVYELSGSYDINDKFNIGASYLDSDQSSTSAFVAIDASYKFNANASLTGSLGKSVDSSSSDALINIGLRYDF